MLGKFTCARYHFTLKARTPIRLGAFAGATLRGGFGHVFKRTVCIWPPGDCQRCLLKHTCSYPYIFETAPPPGSQKLRGLDQVPRPFVIEPPEGQARVYQPGEPFDFRLVLIGRGIDYLPYFVFTFCQLGEAGLGADQGQFIVKQIDAATPTGPQNIYAADGILHDCFAPITADDLANRYVLPDSADAPQRFAIHFLTPTRIQSDGNIRTELTFQDLVRALLRRLSSLCYFHCGHELDVNFRALIDQASEVRTVEADLHWHQLERFSGRQFRRIEMGGLEGRITFEAPDAAALRPYLALLAAGEWVHVGKGAVMGLGKYKVESL